MFKSIVFISVLIIAINLNAKTLIVPKVIYGNDDRMDVFESPDSLMKDLSHATAAQIVNSNIVYENNVYKLVSRTLHESGMCKTERFANQLAAADCSGFLVGPDLLVTAGHCVRSMSDCETESWVFDYANYTEEKAAFQFTKDQVFKCKKIIAREQNTTTKNDFALLKLDRVVPNRTPLKIRTTGEVDLSEVMTVIGHPSGVPTKITAGAIVRDITNPVYFVTNADTYGGNSGSAVVDSRTGTVEGILVRGDQDWSRDASGCMASVHRDENGGRGEDVTRITNLLKFLPKSVIRFK